MNTTENIVATDVQTTTRENVTVQEFKLLSRLTLCPFAKMGKFWGFDWDSKVGLKENFEKLFEEMLQFNAHVTHQKLDGFVVGTPPEMAFPDPSALARFLRTLLNALAERDPSAAKAMNSDIKAEDWRFMFKEQKYFIAVFSDCYPASSSRRGLGNGRSFFSLQVKSSFEHRLPKRKAHRDATHCYVRGLFAGKGISYNHHLLECHKYVFPSGPDDSNIDWWLNPEDPVIVSQRSKCIIS